MNAIIMAGGAGSRLRPMTCDCPKPLLTVVNKPIIEHVIELLVKHDIHEIGVTLGYMGQSISKALDDGHRLNAALTYFTEREPLGTAGGVKNAEEFLEDTFVVMSGDGITDIDLTAVIEYHKTKSAEVTIVLKKVENPVDYGVVICDNDGKIQRFAEKPDWSEVFCDCVNTGIYIMNKSVLKKVEENKAVDFSGDLFPELLKEGAALYGYVAEGYWCDVGAPKAYLKANFDALTGAVALKMPDGYKEVRPSVWVGTDCMIDDEIEIEDCCMIGSGSTVHAGAHLFKNCVIGEDCYIGRDASIKESVLHQNVYVAQGAQIRGAVICQGTRMLHNSSVFEGSIVGAGCNIGENCVIKGESCLWPEKTVEEGSVITENVVWQSEKQNGIFRNECVSGRINIEMTPSFLSKLAAAFSQCIGGRILLSHNGTVQSEALLGAVRAGALTAGVKLLEVGSIPLPAARYAVRLFGCSGGIFVGCRGEEASVFLLDSKGINISASMERKVENSMNNAGVKYVDGEALQFPQKFGQCMEYYLRHVAHIVEEETKNAKNLIIRLVSDQSIESKALADLFSMLNLNYIICTPEELSVRRGRFDLTVRLSRFGEKLIIYDEDLNPLDRNTVNLLMNYISIKQQKGDKYVVAEFSAPEAVEEIARTNSGAVVRTKSGTRALVEEIVKHEGLEDDLPVGRMSMYYDGLMFSACLISFLAQEGKGLERILAQLPEFHFSEGEAVCPWRMRGSVMSALANLSTDAAPGQGVRIAHKYGWSLIIPDAKRSIFKIYSEGFSSEYANELTDIYVKKISEIQQNRQESKS